MAEAPITTWFVVVDTEIKPYETSLGFGVYVQLISDPPPPPPLMSLAQVTFPLESVVNFPPLLNKVQFDAASVIEPLLNVSPPAKLEVALDNDCKPFPEIESPPPNVVVPVFNTVSDPRVEVDAKRLVEEAVVVKKLVVVAFVPVALTKVKFCKVVEPVAKMFAAVNSELMKPLVAVKDVEKKLVEVP